MDQCLPSAGSFTLRVMGMKHCTALTFRRSSAFIGGKSFSRIKGKRMRNFKVVIAATALASSPCLVFAQADYPNRPVRLIVASSPGGGTDVQARMFAQKMSESLKQPFTVDNRPGAGDTIGTGLAAKSAPDGYTLLVVSPSFTMAPALYPKFPHDPLRDVAPISLVVSSPLLLLVHPSLPVKSVKDLIALARAKPGAMDIGVGPSGTFTHLAASSFASAANIKVTLIPYQDVAQRYGNAIAGHTHMIFAPVVGALPYSKSGRLRALAVTGAQRSSVLPELPTLSEAGVAGYDVTTWYGWVAPAGTPAAIVNKLSAELVKAVKSPDIVKRLADDGGEAVGSTPEQFRQIIATEIPRWQKAAKDAGLRAE